MKKFAFKFSATVILLLILVAIVFAGGIAFNIYQLAGEDYSLPVVIISTAVEVVALAFTLATAFFSGYSVKDGALRVRIGLILLKIPLSTCDELTLFKASGKIVLYRKDGKYSVILTSAENFDPLFQALKEENSEIVASVQSDDDAEK